MRAERYDFIDAALFKPSTETPWFQPNIFNFDAITKQLRVSMDSPGEACLRNVLNMFHSPAAHELEMGGKFLLAAIALTGSEAFPTPKCADVPGYESVDVNVRADLDCAQYY